ncbi:Baeyer-Villiger monooxygenase [Folsomia candida]|uniref:Baeyer-Villiger monooxygenase n=1 Tax=Folsomia candida TaxID=158441 RepID=A0A226DNA3_FOLCA|nr:Baeyer-Villiger monooxygenase [Folsomia candida]
MPSPTPEVVDPGVLDALIVGAGFSGLYTLWKLRQLGFTTKILEKGPDIGGTWYSNRYPGARVDIDIPMHQLSVEKVWSSFEWSERFPKRDELLSYFQHFVKTLDLMKDIEFNTHVVSATFDETQNDQTNSKESSTTISSTSHDDAKEVMRVHISALDKDGDGFVDESEFNATVQLCLIHDPSFPKVEFDKFVEEADTDEDGKVGIAEATECFCNHGKNN